MKKPVREPARDLPAWTAYLAAAALLMAVLSSPACSSGPSGGHSKGGISITEENGVSVVRNHGEPLFGEAALGLEKIGPLGVGQNADMAFFRYVRFTIASDGHFLVVDSGGRTVREFDGDGRPLRTIGRQGQGPGEFQLPLSCRKDGQGNAYVGEVWKISAFDPQGLFTKSLPLKTSTKAFLPTEDGRLIIQTVGDLSFGKEMTADIILIDWSGRQIRTMASRPSPLNNRVEQISGDQVTMRYVNQQYSPDVVLASDGLGRAIFACNDEYRLYLTDQAGNVSRIFEKDEAPAAVTEKEKDRIITQALRTSKGERTGVDRGQAEQAGHFPRHRPFIDSIICDEEGNVYVVRKRSVLDVSKSTAVDFFDREGRYLYRLTFPCESLEDCLIRKGILYRAETDSETEDIRIVRYRIVGLESLRRAER